MYMQTSPNFNNQRDYFSHIISQRSLENDNLGIISSDRHLKNVSQSQFQMSNVQVTARENILSSEQQFSKQTDLNIGRVTQEVFPAPSEDEKPLKLPQLRQSLNLPSVSLQKDFGNPSKYDPSMAVSSKARIKNAFNKQGKMTYQRNFQLRSVEVSRKAAISTMVQKFLEREEADTTDY